MENGESGNRGTSKKSGGIKRGKVLFFPDRGKSVTNRDEVQTFRGRGGGGAGTRAGGENFFEIGHREPALADFDQGSHQVADHAVEKAVAVKAELQKGAGFAGHPDGAETADGRLTFVTGIGGKGGKVVFSDKKPGGLADGAQIQGPGNMPGTADLHGVKEGGVGDPVKVGFPLGGKAGVKLFGLFLDGKDADAGGEVKVEGPPKNLGGMDGRQAACGDLTQGMNAAVGPAGTGHRKGFAEDLAERGFQGQLDGGVGILALPSEEILAAIGEGEFIGCEFQRRTFREGWRLGLQAIGNQERMGWG